MAPGSVSSRIVGVARAWGALLLGACSSCAKEPPSGGSSSAPPATIAPAPAAAANDTQPVGGDAAPPSSAARAAPAPPWPPEWPPAGRAPIQTAWCTDSVTAFDEGTCLVLPEKRPTELLVYLHGIVPPGQTSPQLDNLEEVIANAARRAGVLAMIPRGRQIFTGGKNAKWWSWPTAGPAYRAHGAEMVRELEEKQRQIEDAIGVGFERRYLAGSSAGAYFVALLALDGGYRADGYAALSGGSSVASQKLGELAPAAFYVGFGRHDSVGPAARALGEQVKAAGWPVRVAEHDVGHGAREIYLDESLAFFRSAREGGGDGGR